jgi:putative flippase GtrA
MNICLFIYLIVGIISAIIYTSLLVIADKCMDLPETMNK